MTPNDPKDMLEGLPTQEEQVKALTERVNYLEREVSEMQKTLQTQNPSMHPSKNITAASIWDTPVTLQQLIFSLSVPIILLALTFVLQSFH